MACRTLTSRKHKKWSLTKLVRATWISTFPVGFNWIFETKNTIECVWWWKISFSLLVWCKQKRNVTHTMNTIEPTDVQYQEDNCKLQTRNMWIFDQIWLSFIAMVSLENVIFFQRQIIPTWSCYSEIVFRLGCIVNHGRTNTQSKPTVYQTNRFQLNTTGVFHR